jgi:hypothetical protein
MRVRLQKIQSYRMNIFLVVAALAHCKEQLGTQSLLKICA